MAYAFPTECSPYHPLSENYLRYIADLTGKPTGIRLRLPASTQLVKNEAFAALKAALELEAYSLVQRLDGNMPPCKLLLVNNADVRRSRQPSCGRLLTLRAQHLEAFAHLLDEREGRVVEIRQHDPAVP